jgi:DnaK suppressor protein
VHQKTDSATNTKSAAFDRQPPAIRTELDQQRRFRIEQLQELTADAAEAIATADDPRLQVTRVLKLAAESALADIEGALRRLEQGTYGRCERCAEPIPWERLEVLPMTGLCTSCQWMAEADHGGHRRSPSPSGGQIQGRPIP